MQLQPPLTPISLVGIAWALASRNNETEIKCAEWTQAYVNGLIQNNKNEKHQLFFNTVIPLLQGVVAKISLTRTNALRENAFLNKMEKARIEEIDSVANLGIDFRTSISNGIGVLGSLIGGFGFATLFVSNPIFATKPEGILPITILGVVIGYAFDYYIQKYRWKNKRKTFEYIYQDKKKKWDENLY